MLPLLKQGLYEEKGPRAVKSFSCRSWVTGGFVWKQPEKGGGRENGSVALAQTPGVGTRACIVNEPPFLKLETKKAKVIVQF